MFNILSSIKDKVQSGVNIVSKTIQNQFADLLEEQKQLEKAEELDQQRKRESKLPWEGVRNTNSKVNGSITDILRDEILELSKNESIFFTKEEDYLYDFKFDLEEYKYNAMKIQEYDKNLADMRKKLVPKKVSDERFWKNYFYHVEIIKMKYSVTSALAQNNDSDEGTPMSDGFQSSVEIQISSPITENI